MTGADAPARPDGTPIDKEALRRKYARERDKRLRPDGTGQSFHTTRWDYDYTGGDPSGAPMDKLADKRIAIIGTGATSVQCVPHLARACKELYVIQRTPSSVDVRNNRPTDPDWFVEMATPGWQQRFRQVEVTKEAEDAWVDLLLSGGGMMLGSADCTPGYYNNEGEEPGLKARLNVGYPGGAMAYFRYVDAWRTSGDFDGLTFR